MPVNSSTKPISQKMGLKPNLSAAGLHIPKELLKSFKFNVMADFRTECFAGMDCAVGFYISTKSVQSDFAKISRKMKPSGFAWICWRKARATALDRNSIVEFGQAVGLESVSSCSVNDDWSALKFMFPKTLRS
jgi:hypothetical protein